MTHLTTEDSGERFKESTATPPEGRPSQVARRATEETFSQEQPFSSPPQDTQAFPSQYVDPKAALSDEVEDEIKEGVWGYLFPLDTRYGGRCLVMRKRGSCPLTKAPEDTTPSSSKRKGAKASAKQDDTKANGTKAGGYLIGRHPECGTHHATLP